MEKITSQVKTLSVVTNGINKFLLKVENKWSIPFVSGFTATILILLCFMYVAPNYNPGHWEQAYASLANNPFESHNPASYRILTPLLAYLLGLKGSKIILLNYFFSGLLLALIYHHYRCKGWSPSFCILSSSMVAFSMTTLCTIRYGSLVDPLTYIFVFLMITQVQHVVRYWFLFFLALLNREAIIFLAVFFIWLQISSLHQRKKIYLHTFLGFFSSLLAYIICRRYLLGDSEYDIRYYLNPLKENLLFFFNQSSKHMFIGVFSAFKLYWLIPLFALWISFKNKQFFFVKAILLIIVCSFSQLFVAIDSSRLMAMAFPALLYGSETLVDSYESRKLENFLLLLTMINFLVPQFYVSGHHVSLMPSSIFELAKQALKFFFPL